MKTSRLLRPALSTVLSTGLALAALAPLGAAASPALAQEPVQGQEKLPTMAQAQAHLNAGRFKEAAEAFGRIAKAEPANGQALFLHAYALHGAGDLKAAHDAHLEAAKFEQFRPIALYNHACVHALWNEKDVAFQSLREALDAGFDRAEQLEEDSDMDNLRGDPRFAAILAELRPAPKLADLAPERRFDFYQGEWEMRDGDRVESLVSVAPAFGGKGWRVSMTDPATGVESAHSVYAYDAANGVWKQTWMDASGQLVSMAGGLEGDALALRVVHTSVPDAANGRAVFQDIGKAGFTYAWQTTQDGGATWKTDATRAFVRR